MNKNPSPKTPARFRTALVAVLACGLGACGDKPAEDKKADLAGQETGKETGAGESAKDPDYSPYHEVPDAHYVGAASCKECHEAQYNDWLESDHYKAMLPPTPENVLGNFNDVEFEHFGHVTRFYRKGDEFWLNTEGPNGERQDYKVEYTFGHYPLQQYLIAFPGGRLQALQVCWDSRPEDEGGQRWYHIYPDEEVPPDDILHWTGRHFNWNFMCADCHSTDLRKNYDVATDSYDTRWSEMNVSCEACHGPASEHLQWAKAEIAHKSEPASAPKEGEPDYEPVKEYLNGKGLVVTLKEPEPGAWEVDPQTLQPKRNPPLNSTVQVEACARCHSHRTLLQEDYVAGKPFFDTHVPSILTDTLYHHDGQIDEEVYVYGSFVQSKMYHSGVRCTDCHNPHTMKLVALGNTLCVRCHVPAKYDTPDHHHHGMDTAGASCVECHMPTKNYMVVDARRDHSLRIPRPDLTAKLGSPNACNQCHADKPVEWAVQSYETWWGKPGTGDSSAVAVHYGEILKAARDNEPNSMDRLIALARDDRRPGIARATAIAQMTEGRVTQEAAQTIAEKLGDPDPAVRVQAVAALELFPPEQRLAAGADSLSDPARAVRTEAARVLAAVPRSAMTSGQLKAFDIAAEEFVERQSAIADRVAGHLQLGLFHANQGQAAKAEEAYRNGIKVEPEAIPARINLAEMLYNQGRIDEAKDLYLSAVEVDPENGVAHDALARFYIRQKNYDEGIKELKTAAELMPRHAETQYFYGVALNSTGKFSEALPYLQKAHDLEPDNLEYLAGLATICRDAGQASLALQYAEELVQRQPNHPGYLQLLQQIRAM